MQRSDWNRDIEWDQGTLMSVLFLLVSFAAMAERAANLPHAARLEILRFLRQGETVGGPLAIAAACTIGAPVSADFYAALARPLPDQRDDNEALRLAVRFQQLALLLIATWAWAQGHAAVQQAGRLAAGPSPLVAPPRVQDRLAIRAAIPGCRSLAIERLDTS